METGALMVYTSADSVFQVAAHEDIVPIEELYHDCELAREMLTGDYAVGRVIARPFVGEYPNYTRTPAGMTTRCSRPAATMLNNLETPDMSASVSARSRTSLPAAASPSRSVPRTTPTASPRPLISWRMTLRASVL